MIDLFEDDRVSRMSAGKKDFVKKEAVKKQRRNLLDTLQNLHVQFTEQTNIQMSRAYFFRCRPFWVTFPIAFDRDTFLCQKHANIDFMIQLP